MSMLLLTLLHAWQNPWQGHNKGLPWCLIHVTSSREQCSLPTQTHVSQTVINARLQDVSIHISSVVAAKTFDAGLIVRPALCNDTAILL